MVYAEDGGLGKKSMEVSFSSRADAGSRPKGFSTTTRASAAQPD
jgi:hypothetical protein